MFESANLTETEIANDLSSLTAWPVLLAIGLKKMKQEIFLSKGVFDLAKYPVQFPPSQDFCF